MVSNSLTLASWKAGTLRLELESLTIFLSFFIFKAKISYIYVLILSNNCYLAFFKNFTCFLVKIVGIITNFIFNGKNPAKISPWNVKTALHSSSFQKVRELAVEVNNGFDSYNTLGVKLAL